MEFCFHRRTCVQGFAAC